MDDPSGPPSSRSSASSIRCPRNRVNSKPLEIQAATSDALEAVEWRTITSNQHGDWINQRSDRFSDHDPICEPDNPNTIFILRSNGLQTNRDAWNYNSSRPKLETNINRMVDFFNSEVGRFAAANPQLVGTVKARAELAKSFLGELDSTKFAWDRSDFNRAGKCELHTIDGSQYRLSTYRPFFSQHTLAQKTLNKEASKLSKIYPTADARTPAIGLAGKGGSNDFTCLVVDRTPDLVVTGAGNAMQFVPLQSWDENEALPESLFETATPAGWSSNINPHTLARYQQLDASITDEDLFFYVYAILHSRDYRTAFAADLKKSLPRIPQVGSAADFWAFSQAGRDLADLHLNYEQVEAWPGLETTFADGFDADDASSWRIEKMRYPKTVDPETNKKVDDKTTVQVNSRITITGIPERAHDYILGSRSAIDWTLNQYQVKTHKASGIVNDPNDWATEHNQPTYIYDLLRSVVTVSMRTLDLIDDLPPLDLS